MKGFDVLHVDSAVKSRNLFDLSCDHLTTMDFGQIVPLYNLETVPGDKINVNSGFFSRMAPLVKPTYGKFRFKTVTGFVPYHQIADDAEAWLAGKTTWEGQTPHQRNFTVATLVVFIRERCCTTVGATESNAEFVVTNTDGSLVRYVFTAAGRYYVKVLNALGYAIPSNPDLRTTSEWYNTVRPMKLSAYPLLAFFKLYNDYMSQSQRFNTSELTSILYNIKHAAGSDIWTGDPGDSLNSSVIYKLFSNLKLNYDNDYFTSAWQNPNAALGGAATESVTSARVPGLPSPGIFNTVSSTLNANVLGSTQSGAAGLSITQRALDMLRMFDTWVRRNNYSGSRSVQQVYSRFGIKTSDYRSNYAHVLGKETMSIQVGDVTSTADTSEGQLGEYSGKAIMNGGMNDQFESDDYGLFVILGYFTVVPMNAYGFDRQVLRNAPLDYYTPEFDGLGADAISAGELYANPLATQEGDSTLDSAVYGFTERYNSYRYGRDKITGEFRNYHTDSPMNTWHTGRNLNLVRKEGLLYAQSSTMNTLENNGSQYNRIFSVTDDSVDHFYLTCHFEVKAMRPMLNLNQVVNLGQGDTQVPRNGNVIS